MAKKLTRAEKIRRYIRENPTAKTVDIAAHFETRYQNVYAVRRKMETPMIAKAKVDLTPALKFLQGREQAKKEDWKQLDLFSSNVPLVSPKLRMESGDKNRMIEMFESKSDTVNHPAHYKIGGIETIDFIEAKNLGYNLGNVVKYITRSGHKGDKLKDLEKAQWYLNREIDNLKK